jgi:predicted AAA+ superfamily ATPase
MSKIYFWDNGIRNAVIEDFDLLPVRRDIGQLWENFLISDRMKMNAFLDREYKGYFWRNYNQAEVDYVEVYKDRMNAYEIKWKMDPKAKISRAFLNLYPDATTKILNQNNFMEFCGKE